jgi:hypothetical protein
MKLTELFMEALTPEDFQRAEIGDAKGMKCKCVLCCSDLLQSRFRSIIVGSRLDTPKAQCC